MNPINFTGLHIQRTPQNKKNINRFLQNECCRAVIKQQLDAMDKKSGSNDVFLKLNSRTDRDDRCNSMITIVDVDLEDVEGKKIASTSFVSDCITPASIKNKFQRLTDAIPGDAQEASDEIFNKFA